MQRLFLGQVPHEKQEEIAHKSRDAWKVGQGVQRLASMEENKRASMGEGCSGCNGSNTGTGEHAFGPKGRRGGRHAGDSHNSSQPVKNFERVICGGCF